MKFRQEIESRLKIFERLGIENQSNGTKLIGKAPHIAPLAWLHTIFKGLNEEELQRLESKLKTKIPEDYRHFLKEMNGLQIFNTTFCLDGLRESYNRTNEINARLPFSLLTNNINERPSNAGKNIFFIGGYDWDGSTLYIDKDSNKVYRCKRENINPINEWNNLFEMIKSEITRLMKLHNDNGIEIDEDQPTVPYVNK